MKQHEIIELVITTVCRHYDLSWQSVVRVNTHSHIDCGNAKKVVCHLLWLFTDLQTVIDTMRITAGAISNHSFFYRQNKAEFKYMQDFLIDNIIEKTEAA